MYRHDVTFSIKVPRAVYLSHVRDSARVLVAHGFPLSGRLHTRVSDARLQSLVEKEMSKVNFRYSQGPRYRRQIFADESRKQADTSLAR